MLGLLLSVLPFAISVSITPGPNNVMVTASAANFGFGRTVPHMLGVSIGFPVMFFAVGLGLGGLFEAFPAVHRILQVAGAAYLLYLAYRIATAAGVKSGAHRGRPLTLLQGALFQWVNPKAWVIAVGAIATYTSVGGNLVAETLIIGALFAPICFLSVATWAACGVAIGRVLSSTRALRLFNLVMALLLAASLVPLVL